MKPTRPDGLYCSFDIGAHSIKAAVVERREGHDRLAQIEQEGLKPFTDFPGEPEYRLAQIQALRDLAARLPISDCRECLAVFNNRELQVKVVELPGQILPDQVEGVLQWEAKKLLSPTFRNEPFLFGFRMLRQSPPTAALAVIPTSHLQRFEELFIQAGIPLAGAYGEVFLALALKDSLENAGLPAVSLINAGHNATHLQIFSTGELRFYRSIPAGLGECSNPPQPGELEVYAQKIRFSFDYFRAVSKLNQIDEVVFFGGGPTPAEFVTYTRDYFAPSRVKILDVSARIDISPVLPQTSTAIADGREKTAGLLPFLPALGAFFAHCDPMADSCNLWARQQRLQLDERIGQMARQLPLIMSAAGIIVMLVVLSMWKSTLRDSYEEARQKTSIAETNLATLKVKLARAQAEGRNEINLSPQVKKALAPVLRDRTGPSDLLFLLLQNRPSGVILSNILVQPLAEGMAFAFEDREEPDAGMPATDGSAPDGGSVAPEPEPAPPGGSGPSSGGSGPEEGETSEELVGTMLILRGSSKTPEALTTFTQNLVKANLVRRYHLIRTFQKPGDELLRFVLKGETP